MQIARRTVFLFAIVAAPVWAQTSTLDLKLPADAAPETTAAQPANAAAPADATAHAAAPELPTMRDDGANSHERPACDDRTYGQPQVHGSVGMGVVAGNRVSGNYETGNVQVSKAFGSCDDPKGIVSVSVDVGQGNFNRAHRHGRWRGAAN